MPIPFRANPFRANPFRATVSRATPSRLAMRAAAALVTAAALAACGKPSAPDPERPPEPQANTELRDAMQAPVEKAQAVEDDLQRAADAQRAAIDAAGG
jgi:hypothetical protein